MRGDIGVEPLFRREDGRGRKIREAGCAAQGHGVLRLRSEAVTKLRKRDFFGRKLVVFSLAFREKSKKSQPLSMTSVFWDADGVAVRGLRALPHL